jgi:hypothetical protein
MATCSTTPVYTNILNLPQVNNIENGDFLIVETTGGTSIIDFADFLIGPENTTFFSVVSTNSANIISLSSQVVSLSTTLNTTLSTTINSLSSQLLRANTFCTFNVTPTTSNNLKSSNISNISFNTATSAVTLNFVTNFKDTNYCVSLNTYSTGNSRLVVMDLQTNYITVCAVDALNKPTIITKGWIQILTD